MAPKRENYLALRKTKSMKFKHSWLLFFLLLGLSSCRIFNPSRMLLSPDDYPYAQRPTTRELEFKIAVGDELNLQLFSNDGFKLIDITQATASTQAPTKISYKVEFDGTAKLPILGRLNLVGLTIRQAELLLEEKYSTFYIKPFILLNVLNRRVYLFPGADGAAKVISLTDDNLTLVQAIAQAGGISSNGKAFRVKLIRGDQRNPQVFLFDLSTLEGFKNADILLQSNDIIYVEPMPRYARGLFAEIGPYLSIATSLLLMFTFYTRLSN